MRGLGVLQEVICFLGILALCSSISATGFNIHTFNYSGYAILQSNLTGINASWIVQSSNIGISTQWAGIAGYDVTGNLIQIGTSYDSTGFFGALPYGAWYECFGEPGCNETSNSQEREIYIPWFNHNVAATDLVDARIALINETNHLWMLNISNINKSWNYPKQVSFLSGTESAAFVEETQPGYYYNYPLRGLINSRTSLAYFGHASFGSDFTQKAKLSVRYTLNGTTHSKSLALYNTSSDLFAYSIVSTTADHSILANPDPITPDGTSFWVTYGDLRVANISHTSIVFGRNTTFEAVVPGDAPNSKLLYQWDEMSPDFSILHSFTTHNQTITIPIKNKTILAVFVTDNSASDPKPEAYNWTHIGNNSVIETPLAKMEQIAPYSVPITLTNTQQYATPIGFQQVLDINSRRFPAINSNWTNVDFTDATGEPLQAWVENNATNSSTQTAVWVRLNNSIPAFGTNIIYMDIMPYNVMSTNSTTTGEAPKLSPEYIPPEM